MSGSWVLKRSFFSKLTIVKFFLILFRIQRLRPALLLVVVVVVGGGGGVCCYSCLLLSFVTFFRRRLGTLQSAPIFDYKARKSGWQTVMFGAGVVQEVVAWTSWTATRAGARNSSAGVTVSWSVDLAARRCRRASTTRSVSTFYRTTSCVTARQASAARSVRSSTTSTFAMEHLALPGRRAGPPTTTVGSNACARPGGRVPAASTCARSDRRSTPRSRSSSMRRHWPSPSWYGYTV